MANKDIVIVDADIENPQKIPVAIDPDAGICEVSCSEAPAGGFMMVSFVPDYDSLHKGFFPNGEMLWMDQVVAVCIAAVVKYYADKGWKPSGGPSIVCDNASKQYREVYILFNQM